MTFTKKDVYATLVLAVGIVLALSVLQGWNWPLMNGVRTAIIALGLTGMFSCAVSGWADGEPSFKSPFMVIGALLGVIALGAGVIGLVTGSAAFLVAMMTATIVIWLITAVHRVLGTPTQSRPLTTA